MADTTPLPTTAADTDKIAAIREELPATQRIAYLNTGTNGPLPRRSYAALIEHAKIELEQGRVGPGAWERYSATMNTTQAAFAALLGCADDELALTHNTTEGMNIALMGLDWAPGDEVVTATSEHEGGLNPVALLHERYGVTVRYTPIGLRDCDPVAELARVLSPRTKAVALSHVSWATGAVLPMRELSDLAHDAGALMICDAAQSCGMLPANVYELGVDAYACSGQKWLCGPDGTGALFVRRDCMDRIQQTYIGYWGIKSRVSHAEAIFEVGEGAKRYQFASLYPPAVNAMGVSLNWIAGEVGWDWAYRRTRELGRYCHAALARLDGVSLYLPEQAIAGLIHFTVAGVEPADLTTRLGEQGIIIRHTPEPQLNRVATGFYNTEAEIDRLAECIAAILDSAA
jgi:L-cysteine/cystine lyase